MMKALYNTDDLFYQEIKVKNIMREFERVSHQYKKKGEVLDDTYFAMKRAQIRLMSIKINRFFKSIFCRGRR